MANTRTAEQVNQWLRNNSVQTGLSEADTMAAINANPALRQKWLNFASDAPRMVADNFGRTGGIVPMTVEPRHQFEKEALTALGSGTIGRSDPRVTAMFDRFSNLSGLSEEMLRKGASGFNEEEFDQYRNKYTSDVTDATVSRLNDQAMEMRAKLLRQQASNRGNATFGDLYGAQQLGDIDQELLRSSRDVIARGNEAGFNTALEALFRQRGNELSAGGAIGNLGGQQISAATSLEGILGSELERGLTQIGAQYGAGANIRGFNQDLADLAFQNYMEPVLRGNTNTTNAVSALPAVQGKVAQYTAPSFNRFGNIAQGVAGIAESAKGIRF